MAYPGHGNYPANFDPRERSWFTKAVEHGVIVWDKFIDASTGQQVYTLSKPIRSRRGKPSALSLSTSSWWSFCVRKT